MQVSANSNRCHTNLKLGKGPMANGDWADMFKIVGTQIDMVSTIGKDEGEGPKDAEESTRSLKSRFYGY